MSANNLVLFYLATIWFTVYKVQSYNLRSSIEDACVLVMPTVLARHLVGNYQTTRINTERFHRWHYLRNSWHSEHYHVSLGQNI